MNDVQKVFIEFQNIPVGVHIDNPYGLVLTDYTIALGIEQITNCSRVCFTRLSLKHFSEKGYKGRRLFTYIPVVLKNPDEIRITRKDRRYLVSKIRDKKRKSYQAVVLDVDTASGNIIIVTSFITDAGYLKNFDLLWRAGILPQE